MGEFFDEARREMARLTVHDGRLVDADGLPFSSVADSVWSAVIPSIWVMDRRGNLYATNRHVTADIHHGVLAGGAEVAGAGEMVVVDGRLLSISNRSAAYRSTLEMLQGVARVLGQDGLDLEGVNVVVGNR